MSTPNQLVENQSVPDSECWSRVLTNIDHVTRNGTVHLSALRGQGVFCDTTIPGFTKELTGRLVSLLQTVPDDVIAEATARLDRVRQNFNKNGKTVPSKLTFVGVACATAAELRVPVNTPVTDVVYTPMPGVDTAHADVVANVANEGELDNIRAWLTRQLRVIKSNELVPRLQSCGM
jgi:hypothetical protein